MTNFLFTKLGLRCLYANHNIFITNQGTNGLIIITVIDNLNILALCDSGIILYIKLELTVAFKIVDMGSLAFYIGLKVTQNREKWTIKLSQPRYIKKLLDYHDILKLKTAKVFVQDTVFFPSNTPTLKVEKAKYAAKIGSIIYAMIET